VIDLAGMHRYAQIYARDYICGLANNSLRLKISSRPMRVYHLVERCPEVLKYLALPAGWRFLVAGDYEDVCFDAKLLEV
jgi:hypothetical protein